MIRKKLFLMMLWVTSLMSFAQNDKIYKHNGEIIEGTIIKVNEYTIVFNYLNENAENVIGHYAIEKIVYGKSGRIATISEKIVVNSEKDWGKVLILEDKLYTIGLKKEGEIRAKTAYINLHTGNTGDKKVEKKMKMEAAKIGCPFILLTSDKTTVGADSNSLGGTQVIKKSIAYKY